MLGTSNKRIYAGTAAAEYVAYQVEKQTMPSEVYANTHYNSSANIKLFAQRARKHRDLRFGKTGELHIKLCGAAANISRLQRKRNLDASSVSKMAA